MHTRKRAICIRNVSVAFAHAKRDLFFRYCYPRAVCFRSTSSNHIMKGFTSARIKFRFLAHTRNCVICNVPYKRVKWNISREFSYVRNALCEKTKAKFIFTWIVL